MGLLEGLGPPALESNETGRIAGTLQGPPPQLPNKAVLPQALKVPQIVQEVPRPRLPWLFPGAQQMAASPHGDPHP